MLKNKEMARIVQNLIDEAEENFGKEIALDKLRDRRPHYELTEPLVQRRADIDEGISLVEALNAPQPSHEERIGTIREALDACKKSLTNPAGRHWVDVAIGFLTKALDELAAQKPKVPLTMLRDVYKVALDYGRGLSDWDQNACIDIAARYGVEVE
jgi:hypothetical protein